MRSGRSGCGRSGARVSTPRPGTILLLAATLAASPPHPLAAQERTSSEPHEPAAVSAPDLRGTWILDDEAGTVVSIYDLRDYMPDGAPQLTFFEPTSGRLRTLDPDGPGRWSAGPAWFTSEPVEVTVEVQPAASREEPSTLRWSEGETTRTARRVDFPVRSVAFRSGGATLRGTLVLPPHFDDGDRLPAVVLVHGSGQATREVPRSVGELLALRGVAALVYDKRGTGLSDGVFRRSSVADFGRDAAAAVAHAAGRPEIDPARVGVVLSSQGGLLLPAIAEANPDLAAVVCRVCPVLPGTETSLVEARGRLLAAGLGEDEVDAARTFLRAQQRYALTGEGYPEMVAAAEGGRGTAWASILRPGGGDVMPPDAWGWRYFEEYLRPDPGEVYARFEGPVLGVFGALDRRVPPEAHAVRLRELLEASGHPESEVWVLEGATHGLMLVPEGGSREGPFTRVVPGWHDRLVRWVAARLGARDAGAVSPEGRP